jgi:hypothetical protein
LRVLCVAWADCAARPGSRQWSGSRGATKRQHERETPRPVARGRGALVLPSSSSPPSGSSAPIGTGRVAALSRHRPVSRGTYRRYSRCAPACRTPVAGTFVRRADGVRAAVPLPWLAQRTRIGHARIIRRGLTQRGPCRAGRGREVAHPARRPRLQDNSKMVPSGYLVWSNDSHSVPIRSRR